MSGAHTDLHPSRPGPVMMRMMRMPQVVLHGLEATLWGWSGQRLKLSGSLT